MFSLELQTLRPVPIVLVISEQLLTFGANFWQLRAIFTSLNNFGDGDKEMNRGAATRGSFSHRLKVSVYLPSTCVWNTLTFWFHFEAPLPNCGTSMNT